MNKKLPNRAQVLYIMKHYNSTPYGTMQKHLKINVDTMLEWLKLVLDHDSKERKYREIEHELDRMEMLDSFDESLQSEYDLHNIKRIGASTYYVVKKRVVNELRTFYMVTLNGKFNYLVRFDTPVNRNGIGYSEEKIGCDYEVHSMSSWEFTQLDEHLPVVSIPGDEKHQENFWLSMREMLNKHYVVNEA